MARKRKTLGVVCGCIGGLLALGIVAGVGYKSQGFREWDVKGWFEKVDTSFTLTYDGFEFDHTAAEVKQAYEDKQDMYLAIGNAKLDLEAKLDEEKVLESFVAVNNDTKKQYTISFETSGKDETLNIVVEDVTEEKEDKDSTESTSETEEQTTSETNSEE